MSSINYSDLYSISIQLYSVQTHLAYLCPHTSLDTLKKILKTRYCHNIMALVRSACICCVDEPQVPYYIYQLDLEA